MSLFGKSADAKRPEPQPVRPKMVAPVAAPVPAPVRQESPLRGTSAPCVIGAKTTVKGDILGDEDVQVEGTVEGLIRISRDVRIGPSGVVRATVEAVSIVISGEVVGDCCATGKVEIQATGRLTGNVRAPRIVIAEGAMFRGSSDMSLPAATP
jgi:cytoskeletal protein CcmA (bactofilin family)